MFRAAARRWARSNRFRVHEDRPLTVEDYQAPRSLITAEVECIQIAVGLSHLHTTNHPHSDSCFVGDFVSVLIYHTREYVDEPLRGPTARDLLLAQLEAVLLCDLSGNFGRGQSITHHALFPKYATFSKHMRGLLGSFIASGSAEVLWFTYHVMKPGSPLLAFVPATLSTPIRSVTRLSPARCCFVESFLTTSRVPFVELMQSHCASRTI